MYSYISKLETTHINEIIFKTFYKQINKLGDPVRRVAAKATYQIGLLLENHPAMKAVVLSEIERLLHRTNIATRAQYYGICCLTQVNIITNCYSIVIR